MKNCIITDGAGFNGSNFCQILIGFGQKITIEDNLSNGIEFNLKKEGLNE